MTDEVTMDVATMDGVDPVIDREDDVVYFWRRADWHQQRAAAARDEATRVLHETFATRYSARADAAAGLSSSAI